MARTALMDAVEEVMVRDGYAALSARSVARAAKLNYQLIFYYFRNIDGLFLTTYQRRTRRKITELESALTSDRPLHAFWEAASNPFDAALSLEYMAMSNHNPAIRAETNEHFERTLELFSSALSDRLTTDVPDSEIFSPVAVGMLLASIAGSIGFQATLGITGTVRQTSALVEWCLNRLEPPART